MSYAKTSEITIDFDSWIKERAESNIQHINTNWQPDINGLRWLDYKFQFTGFMTGPIAQYKGVRFQSVSLKIASIEDFLVYCESNVGEKHIFLYDLHYNIGMPDYGELDDSFEFTFYDKPNFNNNAGWKIRYGEV